MSGPTSDELRETDERAAPATIRLAETIEIVPPQDVTAPRALGRFVVLGRIARGGMGEVMRAYDPTLRREVALKLVRTRDSASSARLLREAQALAQLNHPNVVAIYDVGIEDGAVYIAMEYVEGRTLRTWWKDEAPDWRRTVAVFRDAARGLAAAHRAGLVHRDVKPDNIIVGSSEAGAGEGRVRVVDFGLARAESAVPSGDDSRAATSSPSGETWSLASDTSLDSPLTQAGMVMGTPAYMAPEQHAGLTADARTDQYALCVALFEALFGERPFGGRTGSELRAAKTRGEVRVPSDSKVPRFVTRAVLRGIAARPDDRWPSLDALLDELARDPSRARTRLFVAGSVIALVGAAAGVHRLDQQRTAAACADEGDAIAKVWNDDARAQVRTGLLAAGTSVAAIQADGVMPWLDGYAESWRSARTETCVEARLEQRWSPESLAGAQSCLDDRRLELEALVGELGHADAHAAQRAVRAAAALTSVDRCRDRDLMARLPAAPSDRREEILLVRVALSRVWALEHAAKYDDALATARATLQESETLGWSPLVAEARQILALALLRKGMVEEATSMAKTAYVEAASSGAWSIAAATADQLLYSVGYLQAQRENGLLWAGMYDVAIANDGSADALREASHLRALADVHHASGDYAESRRLLERSQGLLEETLGPDHPDVATGIARLAISHLAVGEYERAKTLHQRALASLEVAVGPEHPDVAASLTNLANVYYETGELAEAQALNERALAIYENALGPDDLEVAAALMNLGNVRHASGANEIARGMYERALEIRQTGLGADHPDCAAALGNLAILAVDAGDNLRAKELLVRSNRIFEASFGPEHVNLALGLANLGQVAFNLGEIDEAKALYERSLAIHEAVFGLDHLSNANIMLGLADVAGRQHDVTAANQWYERVLAIREKNDVPVYQLAEARFWLARSLWSSKPDRARARGLAERAAQDLRTAGPTSATLRSDAEAWLSDHELHD